MVDAFAAVSTGHRCPSRLCNWRYLTAHGRCLQCGSPLKNDGQVGAPWRLRPFRSSGKSGFDSSLTDLLSGLSLPGPDCNDTFDIIHPTDSFRYTAYASYAGYRASQMLNSCRVSHAICDTSAAIYCISMTSIRIPGTPSGLHGVVRDCCVAATGPSSARLLHLKFSLAAGHTASRDGHVRQAAGDA